MRRVIAVVAAILCLIAGIVGAIFFVRFLMNFHQQGNNMFLNTNEGSVTLDNQQAACLFLNLMLPTILSLVGGLMLLMPSKMLRKKGQPESSISDMKTNLKGYRTGGALCVVGGVIALATFPFTSGQGFIIAPLVTLCAGISGLLLGILPLREE